MSRGQKLAKNTTILFIGKVSTQFVSFFLLPLYTAVLTTEEYGIVDLFGTSVSLLLPIVTLCIEYASFKYMLEASGDKKVLSDIISNTLWFVVITCLGFTVAFFIVSPFIINEYKYYILINLVSGAFVSVLMQFSRGLKDLTSYTIASFISATANIVFNLIFLLLLHMGASGMLLANFIANIVIILFLLQRKGFFHYINFILPWKINVKGLLKYSLPIIPNTLSGWILNASDRIIVTSFLGLASNGILAIAYKFSNVFLTFFNIFYLAWSEMSVLHLSDEDGDQFFSKMFNMAFKVFSSVCLLVIAIIPFVFPLLINANYNEAYYHIPIFLLAMLSNSGVGMLGTVYVKYDKTKELAKITTTAAIINLVVNLILINSIGLYAASISSFVGYSIVFLIRVMDVKKYVKINYDKKYIILLLIVTSVLLFTYYKQNLIGQVLIAVFIFFFTLIINKQFIGIVLNQVKSKLIR